MLETSLKGYIEERAIEVANFIIGYNATVRETAKKFGISKSTIQTVLILGVGCIGCSSMRRKGQTYGKN